MGEVLLWLAGLAVVAGDTGSESLHERSVLHAKDPNRVNAQVACERHCRFPAACFGRVANTSRRGGALLGIVAKRQADVAGEYRPLSSETSREFRSAASDLAEVARHDPPQDPSGSPRAVAHVAGFTRGCHP